eukprot:15457361-Alexandrium_andersonii.AAC.1
MLSSAIFSAKPPTSPPSWSQGTPLGLAPQPTPVHASLVSESRQGCACGCGRGCLHRALAQHCAARRAATFRLDR